MAQPKISFDYIEKETKKSYLVVIGADKAYIMKKAVDLESGEVGEKTWQKSLEWTKRKEEEWKKKQP